MNAVVEQKPGPVHRKVAVGAAVGGLVSVIVWAADTFGGIKVSAEAAVGLSTALTFIVSYLVPAAPAGDQ